MAFRHFFIVSLLSSIVIPSVTFAQDPPAPTNNQNVPAPAIVRPSMPPEVRDRIASCLRPQGAPKYLGDIGDHWSVGSAVSAQLVKYDLASKQVSFNRSIGVGASFRFYTAEEIDGKTIKVSDIKPECRATSFSATDVTDDPKSGKLISNWFSITPTLYATQAENSDLSVQPAILLGVFRDILNIGTGFNLTGPDKGHTFLLFSIGSGFNF